MFSFMYYVFYEKSIINLLYYHMLLRWLSGKEPACNAGDAGLIPGSGKSPGEGKWPLTPGFLPGESHGQRSLVGYSPWCRKESDMT